MSPQRKTRLIPQYWSAEQALAVYEFLQQLTDLVWERYQLPIDDLIGPLHEPQDHPPPPLDPAQSDLFDSDSDLPF